MPGGPNVAIARLIWQKSNFAHDYTDNAGNGVLIAVDKINFYMYSEDIQSIDVTFKLLYRFRDVGLTEYLGILQSQQ